jgi:salicylate hydroxylase
MVFFFFFLPTIPMTKIDNWIQTRIQAHAATPFLGAGAGEAMEVSLPPPNSSFLLDRWNPSTFQDAWILAALLSHPLATRDTATQVLGVYSRIRQPLATKVARLSRVNGENFGLRRIGPDALPSQLQEIMKNIQENFDHVSEADATQDMQRAMELLQAELTV